MHLRRRGRLVHRRRVRGDAAFDREVQHRDGRRSRAGAPSARGRICISAVRRRPFQRIDLRRVDPADLHRLRRLRGVGARIRPRQTLRRGSGLLLAIYGAGSVWRRRRAVSAFSAVSRDGVFTAPERRAAALRADLRPAARERQRADGRSHQFALVQRRVVAHGRRTARARHVAGTGARGGAGRHPLRARRR